MKTKGDHEETKGTKQKTTRRPKNVCFFLVLATPVEVKKTEDNFSAAKKTPKSEKWAENGEHENRKTAKQERCKLL